MRIVYVSQYFPPEMGAPAARVHELAREWVRLGHQVTVVTGFPNHPTGVAYPGYREGVYMRETIDGIDVVRTYVHFAPNRGLYRRSLNYASFFGSATLLGALPTRGADVVIGTSPQLLAAVAGFALSRLHRCPFVFEVRDIWPEAIAVHGVLSGRLPYGVLKGLVRGLYHRADLVVGVSDHFAQIFAQEGVPSDRVRIVRNGVDPDLFQPGPRQNDFRRRHGLEERFVVSYVGTMGHSHDLHNLLLAAHELRSDDGIRFVLVGEGAEKESLARQASEMGLGNVLFVDRLPKEEMPLVHQASDAGLVHLKDIPLYHHSLPSKMFEIMACARPIVLAGRGISREILTEADAGVYADPGDPKALAVEVRRLREDPALGDRLGRNGHDWVVATHTRAQLAKRYLGYLEEAVSRRSRGSAAPGAHA